MVSILNIICCTGCLKRSCSSIAAQKALAVGIVVLVLVFDLLGVVSTLVRYDNTAMRVAVPLVLCYLAANFFSAFFQASFRDAGKCSDKWTDLDRVCTCCHKRKPMRACHCSTCGVCVRKYDHHCPWIGNCVGVFNYPYFFAFLLYTLLVQVTVAVVDIVGLCHSNVALAAVSLVAALLVFLGVSYLFFFHCYLLAHNLTTVEYYRVKQERARNPAYRHPYDQGFSANFSQVYPQPWRLLVPCTFPVATNGIWTYDYAENRDIRIPGVPQLTNSLVRPPLPHVGRRASRQRAALPAPPAPRARDGEQRLESLVQNLQHYQNQGDHAPRVAADRQTSGGSSSGLSRANTDLATREDLRDVGHGRLPGYGPAEPRDGGSSRAGSQLGAWGSRPTSRSHGEYLGGQRPGERPDSRSSGRLDGHLGSSPRPLSRAPPSRSRRFSESSSSYSSTESPGSSSRDSLVGSRATQRSGQRAGSGDRLRDRPPSSHAPVHWRGTPAHPPGPRPPGSWADLPPRGPSVGNSRGQARPAGRRPDTPARAPGSGRPHSEARGPPPESLEYPDHRRKVSSSRSSRASASSHGRQPSARAPLHRDPSPGMWFGEPLAHEEEPPTYSPSLGTYAGPSLRRPESGSSERGLGVRQERQPRYEEPPRPAANPPRMPSGRPDSGRSTASHASYTSHNSRASWSSRVSGASGAAGASRPSRAPRPPQGRSGAARGDRAGGRRDHTLGDSDSVSFEGEYSF